MTIGEKLKDLREAKDMSMSKLAEKTGISIVSICGYETGKHIPNLINLHKLSKALDCSFDELYNLIK